ncbi:MAG: methyltransferase [Bryobacteraceae bacterium]|nr:methyltransferase [Bryobacteraceae bacterium]MDW8380228.1 methyltransferase [Bryobacterales bacterium]
MIPIRFGTDEEFQRVRQLFLDHGFTDEEVSKRYEEGRNPFLPYGKPNHLPAESDAQEALIGLFLKSASTTREHLLALFGSQGVTSLERLGLLQTSADGRLQGSVRIRPMFELYIISDHWLPAEHRDQGFADDVVFPPDTKNALTYLPFLPLFPCQRYLEVCGGSGAAALIAAKNFAQHAYSFDITERSTAFAQFSSRLNGISNFTARQGDLYEPAGDLTFDRIAAHPPFVPVLDHTWTFHAGGQDGEQITRRLIQELPSYLAPGGRFYCRCLGSDREEGPMEVRLRRWLGAHQAEFDIALAVIQTLDPAGYVSTSLLRSQSGTEELSRWKQFFDRARIYRFLACMIVIQRRAEPRTVFTARREHGPYSGPQELEWLIQWETLRAKGEARQMVLHSKLKAGPVELTMRHTPGDGDWEMQGQVLSVKHPYRSSWEVEPWAAYLLPKPAGKMTGLDVYRHFVEQGALSPETPIEAFADALAELVSGGFLVPDTHPHPTPKKHPWNTGE